MRFRHCLPLFLALFSLGPTASPAHANSQDLQELVQKRISANINEVPLRQVFKLLCAPKVPVIVDSNVPDTVIKARIEDRPFLEAFQQIVRLASTETVRIQFALDSDAILVMLNPNSPAEEKTKLGAKRKVLLSLKEVPLKRALGIVFSGSGLQYSIHPTIPDIPVTVDLKTVTIEQALPLLVEATSKQVKLAITLEGDVYIVRIAD